MAPVGPFDLTRRKLAHSSDLPDCGGRDGFGGGEVADDLTGVGLERALLDVGGFMFQVRNHHL
jgi:hypothetical protein